MGGTTTVNDSLRPPKHRQFSLEDVAGFFQHPALIMRFQRAGSVG